MSCDWRLSPDANDRKPSVSAPTVSPRKPKTDGESLNFRVSRSVNVSGDAIIGDAARFATLSVALMLEIKRGGGISRGVKHHARVHQHELKPMEVHWRAVENIIECSLPTR